MIEINTNTMGKNNKPYSDYSQEDLHDEKIFIENLLKTSKKDAVVEALKADLDEINQFIK